MSASPLPLPLVLCDKDLLWVDRCDHLGHELTTDRRLDTDCHEKRAAFIDSAVKVNEMFSFAHPMEITRAVDKYCTAFYGSNIYDFRTNLQPIVSAWKTNVKLTWNLPRGCRSYCLDFLLSPQITSLRARLMSRFHTFFISLLSSPSTEVRTLSRLAARDLRSNLGSNLRLLSEETGLDPWQAAPSLMKARLRDCNVTEPPREDLWRLDYLQKLLEARQMAFYNCDKDKENKLTGFINSLTIK